MKKSNRTQLIVETNRNKYRPETQAETLMALESLYAHIFMHKDRCHLKRSTIDGLSGHGYITLQNALDNHILVEMADSNKSMLYASLQDMVNDGWVID